MLHSSIGFTVILNNIVGWGGAWLFPGLSDITGASAIEIICAWQVAMDTIEVETLLGDIESECPTLDGSYNAWNAITSPIYSLLTTWLFSGKLPNPSQQEKIREVLSLLPKYGGKDFKNRQQQIITDLKSHDVPAKLAMKIATCTELCSANEIVFSLREGMSISDAIVSYYALGEASSFLPIIRLLETRRSAGGWDPAAKAILQSRFLHLQGQLMDCIDLTPEIPIGVDRLVHRLKTGRLETLSSELDTISGESGDLASLIVANARALTRVKREFSGAKRLIGTKNS
jgi:NAD-specific glutamate dehydrogenase